MGNPPQRVYPVGVSIELGPGFFWLIAALPVVAMVHELGHAVTARWAGYRVSSIGFGHANGMWSPLLCTRRGGVSLFLGLHWWAGARCVAIPRDPIPHRLWVHRSGGLFAQALLGVPLFFLASVVEGAELAYWFNAAVLLFNLVPWRFRSAASDGWHLLAPRIAPRRIGFGLAEEPILHRIRRHEHEVGSRLGTAWSDLALARIGVVLGRNDPHDLLFDSEWQPEDSYLEAFRAYVLACLHRAKERPLAALQVCQKTRQQLGGDVPALMSDLLCVAEARAYVDLEEAGRAQQCLAQVAGVGGLVGQESAVVRLEIAILVGNADQVETSSRRLLGRIHAPFLDAPNALRSLQCAIAVMEADGRHQAVESNRSQIKVAANRLIAAVPVGDRSTLAVSLGQHASTEKSVLSN